MFQCLPGLYSALFDKVQEKEEAKCHPLTRFALMALARKNSQLIAIEAQFTADQNSQSVPGRH